VETHNVEKNGLIKKQAMLEVAEESPGYKPTDKNT
jgi:hypothetical protein